MSNNNSTNNNNNNNSSNNNNNSNNNIKQNSAMNFKLNTISNDVNIRNFIDMRTLLASSSNRPLSAPSINHQELLDNNVSTPITSLFNNNNESSIYNKLKNTSTNLINFEKQKNDIIPVETIYTTGDTGARRYGVPAFRPRSSSAQRPSAVDRALHINSINNNRNMNTYFPSPLRGVGSSSNNNIGGDINSTRPMTGNSQNNRSYNNESNNNTNNKQAKLADMLEGNIIERLDHALGRR